MSTHRHAANRCSKVLVLVLVLVLVTDTTAVIRKV
ncbi:hypothetical protein FHS15_004083 [Paenibacillus castaneae]|nr:hypothetical protein [Paenibacillus castaneae]